MNPMDEEAAEAFVDSLYGMKAGEKIEIGDLMYFYQGKFKNMVEHRWATTAWHVFERAYGYTPEFIAFPVDEPSTEVQEDQGMWCYSRPEFFAVNQVQTITYKVS